MIKDYKMNFSKLPFAICAMVVILLSSTNNPSFGIVEQTNYFKSTTQLKSPHHSNQSPFLQVELFELLENEESNTDYSGVKAILKPFQYCLKYEWIYFLDGCPQDVRSTKVPPYLKYCALKIHL